MAEAGKMKGFAAVCAVLPLLLSGCGGKNSASRESAVSADAPREMVAAEIREDLSITGGPGGITAVDAATGDASAMPDDSDEAVQVKANAAENESAASGAPPDASPLRPEEPGLLPSVAE